MSEIKWLPEALLDIERLYSFLHSKNPSAAIRAIQTIKEGGALLRASPALGRLMPDNTKRRELFISFGASAYVLRYILEHEETPVIIRVWHSKENFN